MTKNAFLNIHIGILLAQYGKGALLDELAIQLDQPLTDLQAMLADIQKVGHVRHKSSPRKNLGVKAESDFGNDPEMAALIQRLKERFDNRTFLRELKDVRRFLERNGHTVGALKARGLAFPRIARLLVTLPAAELVAMLAQEPQGEFSALGINEHKCIWIGALGRRGHAVYRVELFVPPFAL